LEDEALPVEAEFSANEIGKPSLIIAFEFAQFAINEIRSLLAGTHPEFIKNRESTFK
jgi:hypothetical protein